MEVKPLARTAPILMWDKKLREKPCARVLEFDDKLAALGDTLKATCYASNACGLAAPQIGEFVQVALVHYPSEAEPFLMVNPVIDELRSRGDQTDDESCLSIPGSYANGQRCRNNAKVRRCSEIFYSYQDVTGARIEATAKGMLARVISHETDHLAGWFFTDRIGDCSRSIVMRQFQNFLKARGNAS